jgi:CPA1 family monovalent cation:H+ antiporter
MIVTRIAWMFVGAYGPRWIEKRLGRTGSSPYPPWRHVLLLGWAGIRGGDSLVIALALPYAAVPGAPPQARAILIFITFIVILVTLVVQGLTLTPVIRLLGIVGGGEEQAEEHRARHASLRAGAAALEQLGSADDEKQIAAALRRAADYRLERLNSGHSTPPTYARLRLAMLAAEREAVIGMRDRGEINDAVMRRLQQEFDHEELLLDHDDGV